jgi:hypothetical protein
MERLDETKGTNRIRQGVASIPFEVVRLLQRNAEGLTQRQFAAVLVIELHHLPHHVMQNRSNLSPPHGSRDRAWIDDQFTQESTSHGTIYATFDASAQVWLPSIRPSQQGG